MQDGFSKKNFLSYCKYLCMNSWIKNGKFHPDDFFLYGARKKRNHWQHFSNKIRWSASLKPAPRLLASIKSILLGCAPRCHTPEDDCGKRAEFAVWILLLQTSS